MANHITYTPLDKSDDSSPSVMIIGHEPEHVTQEITAHMLEELICVTIKNGNSDYTFNLTAAEAGPLGKALVAYSRRITQNEENSIALQEGL